MDICKELDLAIMEKETHGNPSVQAGYSVDGRIYKNYLSKNCWNDFKKEMQMNHAEAFNTYGKGGGKEMDERKACGNIYPPKMASFGSSSRMIYNLMKENKAFQYEKKLATVVGGMANLDGYFEDDQKRVFVEAKCREPYASGSNLVAKAYDSLFVALSESDSNNLSCVVKPAEKEGKICADFSVGDIPLNHFDIKQIICHFLGIANDVLKSGDQRKIEFIYLLYNPTALKFDEPKVGEKIQRIYALECKECAAVDFPALFFDILNYLQKVHKIGIEKNVSELSKGFSFRLCDQNNMKI